MDKENKKFKINKKELWRTVKFTLFSISAGVIQFAVSALLELVILKNIIPADEIIYFIVPMGKRNFIAQTIGLAMSIIWNFTFNRKFTFKAANNVPIAMLLAFVFYIPFYPFQIWYTDVVGKALINIGDWGFLIKTGTVMIINFVLEYLWQTFVVFRGSIDKNDIANKEQTKHDEQENGEQITNEQQTDEANAIEDTEIDDVSQKIEVDVILTAVGENAIAVTKIVRRVTSLELPKVKKLVESLPATIAEKKLKDEAIAIADELRSVGATVELK